MGQMCYKINLFLFRQGLELLITAPIVLTVFAAAMAGALFAPVLSRGFERLVDKDDS